MTRAEAIALLAKHELQALSSRERESILLNWWYIDPSDPEYASLPVTLTSAMKALADGPDDPSKPEYEPLVLAGLEYEYRGVLNEYLQTRLGALGLGGHHPIVGSGEVLLACPCCRYLTLDRRGQYDVCPVCFWEDDGNEEPSRYSSANRMSLQTARDNFSLVGAAAPGLLASVLPDGPHRYPRDPGSTP